MKSIEPAAPEISSDLVDEIKNFWNRNVNAEELMGKKVSGATRGDATYFKDIAEQRYRSHRHLLPWIREMTPGKSVLEIGCGIGLDSFEMARHGLRVTAVDLTETAIEMAEKRFRDNKLNGAFSVGDATDLGFGDGSFDYVYSFGVLHHTQDTEKSIREVYRVLKKGGEARIMLYNRRSLNEVVHRITRIPFEARHEICPVVRRFTVGETGQLFSPFSSVQISKDYVYGEGYGWLFKATPMPLYRLLSRTLGWHLMIRAVK